MDNGQIEHIVVPNNITITVDGKELTVHDLKPGMRLEQTIYHDVDTDHVTRVQTVEGIVSHVSPPNFVTLTVADGTRQRFRIPSGQKFTIDGKETDAFGLKDGMRLSATAITEAPGLLTTEGVERTGQMPPPPATPQMRSALLIAVYGPLASEYTESIHMSGRCQ